MTDWLSAVLPSSCPANAGLAMARFTQREAIGRNGFALSSPAFADGEELDPCFTADEEDAVAPPLEWTAPPKAAEELVLVVEDASTPEATCHWLVWGLPPQHAKLLEGEVPPRTGKNAFGNSEWLLPDPPIGETRHYVFQIFATELPLTLMPGASRADLLATLDGNVTACAVLYAPFTGAAQEDDAWLDEDDIE